MRKCGELVQISPDIIALLKRIKSQKPDMFGHEIETHIECEFESGHPLLHAGELMQFNDGFEMWVFWDNNRIKYVFLSQKQLCPAEVNPNAPDWVCELPTGHYGGHSFDLS